jgi:hypothetical protein
MTLSLKKLLLFSSPSYSSREKGWTADAPSGLGPDEEQIQRSPIMTWSRVGVFGREERHLTGGFFKGIAEPRG